MRARTRFARRTAVVAAVTALGAGLLAGCADDGDDGDSTDTGGGKTKITLGLFGSFGFEEAGLYKEYEKLNPDVDVQQTVIERNENYYPPLLNHLTTNSGLADIQGVEVGNISEIVTTQGDKLMDLSKVKGVNKGDFLDWKWAQATSKSGQTVGLGTDVGPMAICYRKDLFEKAGLPTDREELAKLWAGDWNKLVDVGADYKKKAPKGTTFMDSPGGLLNAVLGSEATRFYDDNGEVIYKTNPKVKAAFDLTAKAAKDGLVGKYTQFQPTWDQAFANDKFAAVSCPPWMLGYIAEKANKDTKGKWDVAKAPVGGNWGGSFLVVPKSGKNAAAAAKLAAWLTAPAQQAKLFGERGSFPSAQAAYSSSEVTSAKNDFFGDAPIGTIFAAAAKDSPVQVIGPKDQIIQQGLTDNGVFLVTKGKSAAEAWETATKTIDNNLEK
ncbi:ABC transporter substrate-binding protein [Streptomyces fructofermentans]|uniref:ABC transporter substrate-binding protein n=1 Tax=Streptomyces fructofermentans TaxID=152141 RepID=UPI0033DAACF5